MVRLSFGSEKRVQSFKPTKKKLLLSVKPSAAVLKVQNRKLFLENAPPKVLFAELKRLDDSYSGSGRLGSAIRTELHDYFRFARQNPDVVGTRGIREQTVELILNVEKQLRKFK